MMIISGGVSLGYALICYVFHGLYNFFTKLCIELLRVEMFATARIIYECICCYVLRCGVWFGNARIT